MITYGTFQRVGRPLFERVMRSSLQIPYSSMIVVDDTPSSEEFKAFLKGFAENNSKEIVVVSSGVPRPTRATARQRAIEIYLSNFSEGWLFFQDDDVVLNSGWWGEASQYMVEENVGEIWGVNWDAAPDRGLFLTSVGIDYEGWLLRAFERRGGTHDTLYRREALDGVSIPPELHVYEDAWLHHHVVCNGWAYRVVRKGVRHYYRTSRTSLWDAREKWRRAIEAAVKYGIVEYETMDEMFRGGSRVKAYLSLLRPIIGTPIMFTALARLYGFRAAFTETLTRQYLKFWQRLSVLNTMKVVGNIPSICESIRRYHD